MKNLFKYLLLALLVIGAGVAGAFLFPRTIVKEIEKPVEVIKYVDVIKEVEKEVIKVRNVCSNNMIPYSTKTDYKEEPEKIKVGISELLTENDVEVNGDDMYSGVCERIYGSNAYVVKNGVDGVYMCENHFLGNWNRQYRICCVTV